MSKAEKDPLFLLIKSMTKSEKRNFKLYANRINASGQAKFIRLFDLIDQQKELDEEALLQKESAIKRSQLSNLKAHLYRQVLTSLRLSHIQNNADIEIREQLDYARILYNKGLYTQSQKMLERIKARAEKEHRYTLHLEILEFEKFVELQYITASTQGKEGRAQQLTKQIEQVGQNVLMSNRFSNLALSLYGLYLKVGHARNRGDFHLVKDYFESRLPNHDPAKLGLLEKIYLYQAKAWYYYIVQHFSMSYRYAQCWVNLFHLNTELVDQQTDLYVRGLYQLLLAQFKARAYPKFITTLGLLQRLYRHPEVHITENNNLLLFLYTSLGTINRHFLEGTFTEGLEDLPTIEAELVALESRIDEHWLLLFNYKIACMYFGAGQNRKAIEYLNKIINYKDVKVREDIHCFARILSLIAHYELKNVDLLDYQVRSVYRFLAKMDNLQQVQQEVFKFLRNLSAILPEDLPKAFVNLKNKLQEVAKDPFERRPFMYLDIISWLESKIEHLPVQQVIRRKFATNGFD